MLNEPRFALGLVVITPDALSALMRSSADPLVYLASHVSGDWSKMTEDEQIYNDDAALYDLEVISSYALPCGNELWISTEADRSMTTLRLHDEP